MENPEIQISIPVDFDKLGEFLTLSPADQCHTIRLGLEIRKYSSQYILSTSNDDWEQKLQGIKQEYEDQLIDIQNECKGLRKKLNNHENEHRADKEALAASIRENAYSSFKAEVDSLTRRNNDLQQQLSSLTTSLQQKFDISLREWRDFYEQKLSSQNSELDRIRLSYEEKYNALLGRNQNSTMRGQDGESEVYLMLNSLFPTALIEDTHSCPGRGDFIVSLDGLTMMVENKNYTRNVQKSEVDKFYRDIESQGNSDVHCGLLISMNCGISCKEDFSIEVRNGKPVMFLHNIKDNFSHIRLAYQMFKVILSSSNIDLEDAEVRGKLGNVAKSVKRNFQNQKKMLDKYYKDHVNALEQQQKDIIELFNITKCKY
jgi:hypothetical protein